MYQVVCSRDLSHENSYSLIKDYMDIMEIYGKGVVVTDLIYNKLYLNDIAQEIFNLEKSLDNLFNFIRDMEENKLLSQVCNKIEDQVYEKNKIKIKVSLKFIKEKRENKYIIYTIEKLSFKDSKLIMNGEEKEKLNKLVGESAIIEKLKKTIGRVAKSDTTILLYGDTGVGKDFCARLIHSISLRSSGPFVIVDCGSIPENLIESELFGYEGGAFTGASQKGKKGMLELADKGTLFLDEIENASKYLQMKLLRAIEDKTITKVGSSKEIPIDIRIVAATNHKLEKMVEEGKFRKDLYYRLNVIKLRIPSLNERETDVLLLSDYFIKEFSQKLGREIYGLSDEVKKIFLNYNWAGNVRELKNVIEHAVVFEESNYITIESIPEEILYNEENISKCKKEDFKTISELEKEAIIEALNYYGWDEKGKQKASKVLEISRSTIFRKISDLKIEENSD